MVQFPVTSHVQGDEVRGIVNLCERRVRRKVRHRADVTYLNEQVIAARGADPLPLVRVSGETADPRRERHRRLRRRAEFRQGPRVQPDRLTPSARRTCLVLVATAIRTQPLASAPTLGTLISSHARSRAEEAVLLLRPVRHALEVGSALLTRCLDERFALAVRNALAGAEDALSAPALCFEDIRTPSLKSCRAVCAFEFHHGFAHAEFYHLCRSTRVWWSRTTPGP